MEMANIYRQGARDGLLFGALLTATSLLMIYSSLSSILSLLTLVMLIVLPVVLFMLLRRCCVMANARVTIGMLWTLGVEISVCGSLICGAVTYVWLHYIEPDFIYNSAMSAIEAYNAMPQFSQSEMVEQLRTAVNEGLLPSAIQLVVNMMMFTTLLGSVSSLVMAAIIKSFTGK